MDHGRTLRSVKHHELEQASGSIGSEDKPPERIVIDLLEHDRVLEGVEDVVRGNVVP